MEKSGETGKPLGALAPTPLPQIAPDAYLRRPFGRAEREVQKELLHERAELQLVIGELAIECLQRPDDEELLVQAHELQVKDIALRNQTIEGSLRLLDYFLGADTSTQFRRAYPSRRINSFAHQAPDLYLPSVDADDLTQAVRLYVIRYSDKYDPAKGSLPAWLSFRVRRALENEVAWNGRTIRLPSTKSRESTSEVAELNQAHLASVSYPFEYGWSQSLEALRSAPGYVTTLPLEAVPEETYGEDDSYAFAHDRPLVPSVDVADLGASYAMDDIEEVLDSKALLKQLIDDADLTPKMQRVVDLRYGFTPAGPLTLRATAEELGVSHQAVDAIEKRALGKLLRGGSSGDKAKPSPARQELWENYPLERQVDLYLEALRVYRPTIGQQWRLNRFSEFHKAVGVKVKPMLRQVLLDSSLVIRENDQTPPQDLDVLDGVTSPEEARSLLEAYQAIHTKSRRLGFFTNKLCQQLESYIAEQTSLNSLS